VEEHEHNFDALDLDLASGLCQTGGGELFFIWHIF
jgi:hypothetical protein